MAFSPQPVNFPNAGHFYSNITKPVEIFLQFTVTPTNGEGTTSLMSNGYVENVFMHTSTTPTGGNPNPASGIAVIQLAGNFKKCLGMTVTMHNNAVGSQLTSVTANTTYVIGALGTTTLAQWQAAGLPAGFTPAVGQAFVATSTGSIGGTGTVQAVQNSGIISWEFVGGPSGLISNSNQSANGGAQILIQSLAPTSSSVTTTIPTAPAAGTIVRIMLWLDTSSVTVDGL